MKLKKPGNYNFEVSVNSLKQWNDIPEEFRSNVPAWAIYFEWEASNWSKNRNGYIIRAKAWNMDKWAAIENYLQNWKITYQHDSNKPIGKPLAFKVKWDKVILKWWVYDNTYTDWNIWKWLVTSLSTTHITHAIEFQHNSTGKVINEATFNELPWREYRNYTMVVTKADIIDNSFVTMPSNRDTHIITKNYLSNKLWKTEDEINNLFSNNTNMKVVVNGILLEEENAVKVLELLESNNVEVPEVKEEEKPTGNEWDILDENKVNELIDGKIIDETKINELISEAVSNSTKTLQEGFNKELNTLRNEKKEDIANIAKNNKKDTPKGDVELNKNEFKGL